MTLHLGKPALTAAGVAADVREAHRHGTEAASPWLSVVIVAYNEEAPLLALAAALCAQLEGWGDAGACELIMVDNGLAPSVRAELEARFAASAVATLYLVAAGNLGCSQGRNVGVAYARAPWVAFVDADGAIDAGYLRACAAAIAAPDVVAVRGRVLPRVPTRGLPAHYDLGAAGRAAPISTEGISLWRRANFVEAGGFEAELAGGEGPVLCYRLAERQGCPPAAFVYAPTLCLWHDYYVDEVHLRAKLRRYALARLALDRRYPLFAAFLAQFERLNAARGLPRLAARASRRVMVAWIRARLEAEVSDGEARRDDDHGSARVAIAYHAAPHASLPSTLRSLAADAAAVLVVPAGAKLARATSESVANIFELAPDTGLIMPWIGAPVVGDGLPGEVRDAAWLARSVPAGPWAVRASALAALDVEAIMRGGEPAVVAWQQWLAQGWRVRAVRVVDSLVPPRVRGARWPSRVALAGVRLADGLLAAMPSKT